METAIVIVLGVLLGIFAILFALPLIPHVITFLSNNPNANKKDATDELTYGKSTFGFFTFLQPGRVKIIERGGRFMRVIMDYDGHMFKGQRTDNTLEPEHADYWTIIPTEQPYKDTTPLPPPWRKSKGLWLLYLPVSLLWWIWKLWVYHITGGIFTGIAPFQTVRAYPIERFKMLTLDDGKVKLRRIHDFSDHYRVADFQYPLITPEADTSDKIQVKIILNVIAWVSNAYRLAYNTDDDWTTRFASSISNAVTNFTRSHTLDEVQAAKSDAEGEMNDYVKDHTQEAVEDIGIVVKRTELRDISTLFEKDRDALAEESRAKAKNRADQEYAKGKAAYIREEGEALRAHPNAEIVVQTEGMIRAAEAAGKNGGIVILGGASVDPIQAAILKTLKQNGEART